MSDKICVDCKWYKPVRHYYELMISSPDYCLRPELQKCRDLVYGSRPRIPPSTARSDDGLCGAAGKYWEPKPPKWWKFWQA